MEKFKIEMTKDEMIRYYANKIVEEGIKECSEFNFTIDISNYGNNIQKYKNEILHRIYRDERVADVNIDMDGNFDMVFYTDYCPFYYDENESPIYNDIEDNSIYQAEILTEFADYIRSTIFRESYINTRILINNFVDTKQINDELKEKLGNFLKFNIIKTGFVDKYIDNIQVFVTPSNHTELENNLRNIAIKIENEENEEFE